MRLRTFLHGDENSPTTLSEIQRAHDWIDSEEYLGIFATLHSPALLPLTLRCRISFGPQRSRVGYLG